jgi:hypothetical protein
MMDSIRERHDRHAAHRLCLAFLYKLSRVGASKGGLKRAYAAGIHVSPVSQSTWRRSTRDRLISMTPKTMGR